MIVSFNVRLSCCVFVLSLLLKPIGFVFCRSSFQPVVGTHACLFFSILFFYCKKNGDPRLICITFAKYFHMHDRFGGFCFCPCYAFFCCYSVIFVWLFLFSCVFVCLCVEIHCMAMIFIVIAIISEMCTDVQTTNAYLCNSM